MPESGSNTDAPRPNVSQSPVASVVVPTYNRPAQLEACLETLVAQEGIEYEIIIVDDGSAEPLEPICARFGDRVTYIRQENTGPAAARNRGVEAARGAFVALTDDDCRPHPNWLAKLYEAHGGREDVMVGGRSENGLPKDPFATASQDLIDYLYTHFDAENDEMPFFTSNNIAMSRSKYQEIGGFDRTFPLAAGEDREFGIRWRDTGGRLQYEPGAIIDHFHGMTLAKFWRQHSNYGRGAYHLHKILDERGSELPKREPLSFYFNLLLYPLKTHGLRGIFSVVLMGVTQLAMINGYGRAKRADAAAT